MTEHSNPTGSPDSPNQGGLSPTVTVGLTVGSLLVALLIFIILQALTGPSVHDDTVDSTAPSYAGTAYEPPVQLDDFTFPATTGDELSLSDLRGRYVLMFFGYTHCPDVCPTTLAEFRLAKAELEEALAQEVTFLFVSVDGPRDTTEVITSFLNRFDPDFLGMSGDDETLQRIAPQYGLFYERQTDTGSEAAYLVDHTGRSFLIDREGRLRVSYAYGTDSDVLADGIRRLMNENSV